MSERYALRGLEFYYGEEKSFVTEKFSTVLEYNDLDTIHIVLRGDYQIQVSSDYPIIYTIINNNPDIHVISVSSNGIITGLNVGTAKLNISNGYEEITVVVIVDLFQEPTFEFGCSANRIRELYGSPYYAQYINDTLRYIYTAASGFSYACGEMDFFFENDNYFEADVYIRQSVEYLLDQYLEDSFNYDTMLSNDSLDIYRHKYDNSIICGKFDPHNVWNEICLFYIKLDEYKSIEAILMERQKWSKQFGVKR